MKKIWLYALSFAMVICAAIAGTVAYLTDEDSDVNVMTLGNVKIEQIEQERDENGNLVEFSQLKPLYPAVYEGDKLYMVSSDQQPVSSVKDWEVTPINENVVDKIVTVKNTGKSDAYVRTIIAFETDNAEDNTTWNKMYQIVNRNKQTVIQSVMEYVEINGKGYLVLMYTYKDALGAGETSMPSLKQVYMPKETTNEDCEAVDANNNGLFDILVLSQAVQTNGFADSTTALNTAFGELNAENVQKWFGNMNIPGVISNSQQAYTQITSGGEFLLNGDYKTSDATSHYNSNREYAIRDGKEVVLDLNGYTINHDGTYQDGKNTGYTYLFTTAYNGKLTINGEGTIESKNTEGLVCILYAQGPSEAVINGGEFIAYNGIPVWAGKNGKITINGGTFISEGTQTEELIYSSGGIIDIYGGFFHNKYQPNRPVNVADANRNTGFITIYGGTFVDFDPSTGGNDPNNIKVAEGYKVVSETQDNGDVWYTVVKE